MIYFNIRLPVYDVSDAITTDARSKVFSRSWMLYVYFEGSGLEGRFSRLI
jgi:hypothetical protein